MIHGETIKVFGGKLNNVGGGYHEYKDINISIIEDSAPKKSVEVLQSQSVLSYKLHISILTVLYKAAAEKIETAISRLMGASKPKEDSTVNNDNRQNMHHLPSEPRRSQVEMDDEEFDGGPRHPGTPTCFIM